MLVLDVVPGRCYVGGARFTRAEHSAAVVRQPERFEHRNHWPAGLGRARAPALMVPKARAGILALQPRGGRVSDELPPQLHVVAREGHAAARNKLAARCYLDRLHRSISNIHHPAPPWGRCVLTSPPEHPGRRGDGTRSTLQHGSGGLEAGSWEQPGVGAWDEQPQNEHEPGVTRPGLGTCRSTRSRSSLAAGPTSRTTPPVYQPQPADQEGGTMSRSVTEARGMETEQQARKELRVTAAEQQRAAGQEKFRVGERVEVSPAVGPTYTGTVKECTRQFYGSLVAVIRDEHDERTPPVALVVAERVRRITTKAAKRARGPLPKF